MLIIAMDTVVEMVGVVATEEGVNGVKNSSQHLDKIEIIRRNTSTHSFLEVKDV